ncbi:IS630 family transposase, partial [Shewanella chilikensis]
HPDIASLAKSEKSARKRIRYLALLHFIEGHSRTSIASMLKVSRTSVNKWVTTYLSLGLSGLDDKPNPGRPAKLSSLQLATLKEFVLLKSLSEQGGRLMAKDVGHFIQSEFGVTFKQTNIYRLLHQLGFSWITTRSRHPKQSEAVQEAFKKNFPMAMILNTPGHVALDRIDVWFQDEARFGQQNTTTRIWAKKGTRPRVVKQQQFESAYLFGAVCPATGATQAIIAPFANSDYMHEHLKLISAATGSGRHALVIMDGAGWHQQDLADDFDNLSILKLPPYSPELNPVEQVWQWLRQHVLANRCFSGYDDIVEQCSIAWNKFIGEPLRVIQLCSRQWVRMVS